MINLKIITTIVNNMWQLEFELNEDSTIPRDIFMFENTGSGLGEYMGVCTPEDYRRLQTHLEGAPIPIFGNRFLKYHKGLMSFSIDNDPVTIKDKIINDVKAFKAAYSSGLATTTEHEI